jgi:transposase
VKLGVYNTPSFENFLLEKIVPKLAAPRVFIMDDTSCHMSLSIKDNLERQGHTLHRLPPYSPYLNAVESVFSSIKRHIWLQDFRDRESLTSHINNGIKAITLGATQGWIREVSRSFAKANIGEPLGQYYSNHSLVGEEVEEK